VEGAANCNLNYDLLNKNYTYSFELVSPYNRVVVPYKEIKLYHTGTRNNITLEELNEDIGVQKPKQYRFDTLTDAISSVQNMPFSEEGYVVVDANWNRVKIKSPAYLAIHRLHNNGNINKKSILELVRKNDHHEFLSYFPEYTEYFKKIEDIYVDYLEKLHKDIEDVSSQTFATRKDYALYVKELTNPNLFFAMLDGKITKETWRKYILELPIDKMAEYLKLI
jgi:hypothetical protein